MAAGLAPGQELSGRKGGYKDWEASMVKRDSSQVDVSIAVAAVSGNPGEPISLRWLVRDISDRKRAEQAVRESEERLRSITENAPDFIAELDLDSRFLYVNRPLEGYLREEMIGQSLFDFIPEGYHEELCSLLELAGSSGQLQAAEFKQTLPDGTHRWQSARFAPVIRRRSLRQIVLISTDITERKKMELLLQENQSRLRFALDSAQLAPFDFNILTGELIWDERAKPMWGFPAGESPDYIATLARIHPDDRSRAELALAETMDPAGTGDIKQEFRVVWPDGSVHWISAKGKVSSSGENRQQESAHLLGIMRDITERKSTEEALRASEQKFRMLFENTPDAVFLSIKDGNIIESNPAACAVFGWSEQEFKTLTSSNIFDTQDPRLAACLEERERTGRIQAWEITAIRRDGRSFPSEVDSVILPEDPTRSLVILRDITGRKAMEDLLRENEARLRIAMEAAKLAPLDFNFLTGELVWDERIKKILSSFQTGEAQDRLDYAEILPLLHSEDRRRVEQAVAMAIKAGMSGGASDFEQELRLVWPDGTVQWISAKGKMKFDIVDGQYQATGLTGIFTDITRRKQAEEALRYKEALLSKALENIPVGIWILDGSSRIIKGNPEVQRIWFGAKSTKLPEFGEYKAWRADTGEQIKAEDWAGGLAITQGKVTLNEELEIEAFDGARRIILNSAIPLGTEEDGLAGAIVVNQDITARKHYEEELQRAHDQLATLLGISQSIVSTLDLDRLLNLIIEQLGKVIPYEGAAILIQEEGHLKFRVIRGPSVFNNLSEYQFPISEPTLIAPLVKEKKAFYIPDLQNEASLMLKIQNSIKGPSDQYTFLRSWLGLPLIAKNTLIGILVLAHAQPDYYSGQSQELSQAYANHVAIAIHNAQLYEQAKAMAALEERNRLARELHDSVAQALYSICLFTDATRMALETNKLETVKENLSELTQLAREAILVMRLMIFELRPPILVKAGLAAALQSRLDSVEARSGVHGIFHSEGEVHLSPEQEGELYRIAQEALNNIIKHAHADQVKVQLSRTTGSIRLVIEDNGVGFDPADVEQGGGQGLRNIKERAEGIGAACWVESAPGKGTIITIEVNE
ncbi:MAG: PAS domain S-box protein [Methanothrix sp.]|nr:MAG: PAS domain S-box protein [Methanothrix sp.]